MTDAKRFRIPLVLFVAHLAALIFGLVGLLIMLPNPELWSGDPNAVKVFDWSMEHAGATHIIFGALVIFAWGVVALGWRKTSIFFVVSYTLSLGFELFGTGTGWPFGNYEYTSFLGYKVLDKVPYTIPLSWFYMGLASYLLGAFVARRLGLRRMTLWTVLLGAWFLTVWDLVLDPAMAHESLRVQFWVWDETGPYFGMPIKNFVGWTVTGLVFMALSRFLWREEVEPRALDLRLPLAVYAINLIWAMVLSASVGLWLPILLSAVLALAPALLVLRQPRHRDQRRPLELARDA
jgi:carotene biosynthesis associated membrane protein